MSIIIYYMLGALVVSNIISIWKLTNISVHFFNFFKKDKKIFTTEDLEDHLCMNGGWFGELLMCPLCLSTHLSWIISFIICQFSGCSYWLILASTFSWPYISYLLFILVKNK